MPYFIVPIVLDLFVEADSIEQAEGEAVGYNYGDDTRNVAINGDAVEVDEDGDEIGEGED